MRGGSQGVAYHWAAALASALMMCTWSKDTAIGTSVTPRRRTQSPRGQVGRKRPKTNTMTKLG
eukprot:COSAG04_NODE_3306_length_2950_cov_2.006664_6_plen_63_part_00